MRELVDELANLVRGHIVKDVQGLPPRDLLLILEPKGEQTDAPPVRRVRISVNPEAARIHLQQGRVHRHTGPTGPFFRLLADELSGATLHSIEQVRGDRLALLEFRGTPSGERRALLAELTGRQANLILLGRSDRVCDLLVPSPKKAARQLAIGEPWIPPGGRAAPPATKAPLADLWEAFPAPAETAPSSDATRAPLSWRVEKTLGGHAVEKREESERKKLVARVTRKLNRARSTLAGLEKRADAADRSERVRRDGELLKGMLGQFQRGAKTVVVQDYFEADAPEREITLDPKLAPNENVERFFNRYRKLERARANVAGEIERARERFADLEALARAAEDESQDPTELDADAVARGLLDPRQEADTRKRTAAAVRLPYKCFTGSAGSEIRVGRNSRDNDTLTFRHARGNDLWLHAADTPGSHVVLRLERGAVPDEDEVLDAAHLALHFSPSRDNDRAPVHVAYRKEVHKPRGSKAGLVTLSGGKVLQVRVQPERTKRLLRTDRGRAPGP